MWLVFFEKYNGVPVFHDRYWISNEDVDLFTDSAEGRGMGFGAVFGNKWAYGIWPEKWHTNGLTDDITVFGDVSNSGLFSHLGFRFKE